MIAEIWQHTDAEQPSDEDDMIRLQDDFGRWSLEKSLPFLIFAPNL
jgi:hypothetical protein